MSDNGTENQPTNKAPAPNGTSGKLAARSTSSSNSSSKPRLSVPNYSATLPRGVTDNQHHHASTQRKQKNHLHVDVQYAADGQRLTSLPDLQHSATLTASESNELFGGAADKPHNGNLTDRDQSDASERSAHPYESHWDKQPVILADGNAPLEPKLPRKQLQQPPQPLQHVLPTQKASQYNHHPRVKKPSSLHTADTITTPSRDDNILSCAKIIQSRLIERNPRVQYDITFDIDNYLPQEFSTTFPPTIGLSTGFTLYVQHLKQPKMPQQPTVTQIYNLMKRLFDRAKLNSEIVIIALIYIERLTVIRSIHLCSRNWLPIVITALLVANKCWDDTCAFNAEFAQIIPIFDVQQINTLEKNFLAALQYELYICSSDYAKHYFQLRALRRADEIKQAQRLQIQQHESRKNKQSTTPASYALQSPRGAENDKQKRLLNSPPSEGRVARRSHSIDLPQDVGDS